VFLFFYDTVIFQVHVQVFLANNNYNCEHIFIEKKFDACKLSLSSLGPFGKMLNDAIINSINFELKCPYKIKTYKITNFRLNLTIPLPLPNVGKYCVKSEFFGKPNKQRNFIKLASLGGSGTLKQTKQ
jgi:hypothetical protein